MIFHLLPQPEVKILVFDLPHKYPYQLQVEYTFYLSSDDGSAITVNGQTIVDYDGLHSARTRSGSVNLATGTQQVVVTYFERAGQNSLNVEIAGPQLARTELANLVGF